MKLKALTSRLLIVFLVGCSGTNHDSTFEPTPEQQQGTEPSLTQPTATPIQPQALQTDNTAQFNLSVAKAAKLTPEQVKHLMSKVKNNLNKIDFKIVVPTYIPLGFQIDTFEVEDNPGYLIRYRDSSNYCFELRSASDGFGGSPTEYRTVEAFSPALGKLLLGYTDFDPVFNGSYIGFNEGFIIKGQQGYSFNSFSARGCNVISLQEAVKIVESLEYLNL